MKGSFILLAALSAVSGFGQAKFEAVPTAEKNKQKDLTFLVTFDKHGVNADFAKGDGISTTMPNTNLGLRGVIGFDGKNAYRPESGEDLKYNVQGNIDPHSGTLIFWTAGLDYAPGQPDNNGKKRGNICFAHLVFTSGQRNINYRVYEYAQNVYFDWRSSEGNQGHGSTGRIAVPRNGIRKGEWHQLAFTWNDKRLIAYLNGKKIGETACPEKVKLTADLKAVNNKESFIGIKSPFYEDKHTSAVGMDDVAIYSRPLTALEIENQYVKLLKDKTGKKIEAYAVTLNGVNIGHNDRIDRLEAEFDFSALSPKDETLLKQGKLIMDYTLTGPDGKKQTGKWTFSKSSECRILNGVDKKGRYTLKTRVGKNIVTASIERPDFSWVGNGYGDEDEVPALWKDFKAEGREITVWNRTYKFGQGPLPETITAYGKNILAKVPVLKINGQTPAWKAGKTKVEKRWVTFTGTGTLGKAKLRYSTRVEFDGFIKFDWTISGKPVIGKMTLDWQMAPENHEFLMTPCVNEQVDQKVSFQYPQSGGNPKMLWFVTEKKGGFAFTMVNDANWVYDASKPVFFADKSTGECRVELINKQVTIPEETPYTALFIATPTRPLPKQYRMLRFGDSVGNGKRLIHAGGDGGVMGVYSIEPHPFDFEYRMRDLAPGRASIFGGADILTTHEPEAVYLRKYWEMPGAYSYNMPYHKPVAPGKYVKEHYFTISACPTGAIVDYYLKNEHLIYNHKYGDRIWQIYYDICGNSICGNRLHGCGYTDKFGRDVRSFEILAKRDLIRRTVAYAHRNGRTVILHGQRDYLPMLQGLADYWFPGEQYGTLLRRNPYGYTDEVPDAIYRTEFNKDLLGIGIIHLPALGQTGSNLKEPEAAKYTEAMMCMLQSHDVETSELYTSTKVVHAVWDILGKYGVQDPKTVCRPYYEQKEIKASNPDLRITCYVCPGNRHVLFLANRGIRPVKTEVDASALAKDTFTAMEEYKGKEIAVKDGKFNIRVPARSFRIVCFPPKSFYPFRDTMENCWGSWRGKGCDTLFSADRENGYPEAPALKMTLRETGGGCFLSSLPVRAGKKYRLTVMAKHSVPGSKISMGFQGRIAGKVVAPPVSKSIASDGNWQKIVIEYAIPSDGTWKKCDNIMITLGGTGKKAVIHFDDFQMEEIK